MIGRLSGDVTSLVRLSANGGASRSGTCFTLVVASLEEWKRRRSRLFVSEGHHFFEVDKFTRIIIVKCLDLECKSVNYFFVLL